MHEIDGWVSCPAGEAELCVIFDSGAITARLVRLGKLQKGKAAKAAFPFI